MSGSWHVGVKLEDGRRAMADYRDPIVVPMRKINLAIQLSRPKPPEALAQVAAWLDAHAAQSDACLVGQCEHTT